MKEVKTIGGSTEYGKDGAMDPFERKQVRYFFYFVNIFWDKLAHRYAIFLCSLDVEI